MVIIFIQLITGLYQISFFANVSKNVIFYHSLIVFRYSILLPFQSGFRPNHSTSTALLILTNDVFSASNNGNLTGAIFYWSQEGLWFVNHYLLLDKLRAIGLSRNALWFNNFFHNRRHYVVLQGSKSDLFVLQRRVPINLIIMCNDSPSLHIVDKINYLGWLWTYFQTSHRKYSQQDFLWSQCLFFRSRNLMSKRNLHHNLSYHVLTMLILFIKMHSKLSFNPLIQWFLN